MQLWNRRFARDWGLEAEFLDTHPHVEALLERIAPRLARPQLAKTVGDVVRAATLDRKQTGGRAALSDGRTLRFTGVPLPDGNGLLAVLDITDTQKAETALKERNAALVEADAIKTRFLASMSYEFRTPLTSIGGFAELLQAGLGGELNAQGREYVGDILTSVGRLGEQIESVLDLSQSEAGMLPLAQRQDRAAAVRHRPCRGAGETHPGSGADARLCAATKARAGSRAMLAGSAGRSAICSTMRSPRRRAAAGSCSNCHAGKTVRGSWFRITARGWMPGRWRGRSAGSS